jgi:hypothetical protein
VSGFFVNGPTVVIFDPGRVAPASLLTNDLQRAIEVIGDGFDDPSRHLAPLPRK